MRTSFLLEAVRRGGHTHVSVRAGRQEHGRALCGSLIVENEEWEQLRALLMGHLQAHLVGSGDVVGPGAVESRKVDPDVRLEVVESTE